MAPTRPFKDLARAPAPGPSLPCKVLIADDEPSVRALTRRILVGAGCDVVDMENGEEALRSVSEDASRFDVIVTDLVMPLMGGHEFAKEVGKIRPDLPIVFISGYVDDDAARRDVAGGTRAFLQKPFRPGALLRKIQAVIEAVPTSESSRMRHPRA